MQPNQLTFTKDQAVGYLKRTRRSGQIYLKKFDVGVIFRKGKLDDQQIDKVRYKEDARPQKSFNKVLGRDIDKKNDIVTYKPNGEKRTLCFGKVWRDFSFRRH